MNAARAADWITNLLALVVFAAVPVALWARDEVWWLATFYYATPAPVVAGLGGLAALLAAARQRYALALPLLVPAAFMLVTWISSWPEHAQGDGALRVAVWNAQRSHSAAAARFAESLGAGIVTVVEVPSWDEKVLEAWRNELPGHRVTPLQGGMLVAVRGRAERPQGFAFGKRSRVSATRVTVGGERIAVLVVDLDANPFRWKQEDFDHLTAIIDTYGNERMILLGDFNTPLGSDFWDELRRRNLRHAFTEAGRGAPETWPAPVPVLTLDHIWTHGFVPRAARRVESPSDHYAVVAELDPATR